MLERPASLRHTVPRRPDRLDRVTGLPRGGRRGPRRVRNQSARNRAGIVRSAWDPGSTFDQTRIMLFLSPTRAAPPPASPHKPLRRLTAATLRAVSRPFLRSSAATARFQPRMSIPLFVREFCFVYPRSTVPQRAGTKHPGHPRIGRKLGHCFRVRL